MMPDESAVPTTPTSPPSSPAETGLFRFYGATTTIGQYQLDTYGQLVQLPLSLAEEAVAGGSSIMPDELFNQAGHTDEELDANPTYGAHFYRDINPATGLQAFYPAATATKAFLAKRKKVHQLGFNYAAQVKKEYTERMERERQNKLVLDTRVPYDPNALDDEEDTVEPAQPSEPASPPAQTGSAPPITIPAQPQTVLFNSPTSSPTPTSPEVTE